jgi:peptide/nickel transport system substrate-binding protein
MRRPSRILAALAVLAVVAAACSSSKSSSTGGTTGATPSSVAAKQGGDLVVAAEQEPDCMDWIGSCAGAAWGTYTVESNVQPRAYDFTDKNEYVPGALLSGPADFVASPVETVTYHINPKAVWSDGQPITSHDFKYTWDQIAHGKDIYDSTGYAFISSVDDTDPHTAVVKFKSPFGDWKELFDAFYGVLPSHILEGKNRDALMKDGYTWSAGPWKLDHWTKGVEIKLVPNDNYWGKKPNLSSLTFKFLPDTAAEQAAVKSGQVSAAYPQAQPGQEALKGLPGISFNAVSGLDYEMLWFQTTTKGSPLSDKAVRQALAYATDRNAIVSQLFGPVQPDIKPIQSSFTPAFGQSYSTPFSIYSLDLAKVTSLMTGAGWAKGSDGIWAKGGKRASLELKTTTGNKRRLLTAQILQSQWKAAGFDLKVTTEKAGVLFGKDLPALNFQIGLFAQTPSDNYPAQCNLWCSKNVPGPANGNQGTDYYVSDPALDKPWLDSDTNLDPNAVVQDAIDGNKVLADLVPNIPLDPFPDIVIVNSDRVGSESGTFRHNFAYGPFIYSNEWFLK